MTNNISKLPEKAFVVLNTTGELVMVMRGEKGYYPQRPENAPWGVENMDAINERIGVTKAQAKAMQMGSMFGWDTPASDPDNYDENGEWIR